MKRLLFLHRQMENLIIPLLLLQERKEILYELDLTLRNNITTEENPLGVYHPHAQLSSYQEREYRSDRGDGAGSASGKTERRDWSFLKNIFWKARILLPMRR